MITMQRYTFYSPHVRQVIDNTGIVHETRTADGRSYARETCCESDRWHLIEPVNTCGENVVTTCLSCIGSKHG